MQIAFDKTTCILPSSQGSVPLEGLSCRCSPVSVCSLTPLFMFHRQCHGTPQSPFLLHVPGILSGIPSSTPELLTFPGLKPVPPRILLSSNKLPVEQNKALGHSPCSFQAAHRPLLQGCLCPGGPAVPSGGHPGTLTGGPDWLLPPRACLRLPLYPVQARPTLPDQLQSETVALAGVETQIPGSGPCANTPGQHGVIPP